MKAAICRAFGEPLTIEEVKLGEPGPGEVRVDLKACAICHSDLSYVDGEWGGQLPAIYGHEGAGVVAAVGQGVEDYAQGDHVIVTLIRHCGNCHCCARGQEALCDTPHKLSCAPVAAQSGEALHPEMYCGAFAEAVVVHESQLAKIPDDMAFDVASLLACGVITGYGAVKRASGLQKGQNAVVIGCGGVGLNAIQAAQNIGANAIIALDLVAQKREIAQKFGATHALDPRDSDVAQQVMEITGGRGGDFVFVTVGAKAAMDAAASFIGKMGEVVIVGMPPAGVMSDIDPGTMAAWSQKITGTKMGGAKLSEDIPELVALYRQGKLKLDELISGRFNLEQINEALKGVRNGTALKNVIVFEE